MNKLIPAAGAALALLLFACGSEKTTETKTGAMPGYYVYELQEDAAYTGKLPALQSFVFAKYNQYWILFGGRTAPFHGFNAGTCDTCFANFPVLYANDSVYVFDTITMTCSSMAVPAYGADTGNVFLGSNLPNTQVGSTLYACGGYSKSQPADNSAKTTNAYFMKVNLPALVSAVTASPKNPAAFKSAIRWGKSPFVQNTGGELFRMPDNNFYLCAGHNFSGRYTDSSAVQVYQDAVNVFSVIDSANGLSVRPLKKISDGQPDNTTQFHRRDLTVAAGIQPDGSSIGISIFGGVFTYTPHAPASENGTNFTNPIYITPGGNPGYLIETGANQYSSIYSTAQFCMYDSMGKRMLTTMFGGIGNNTTAIDQNANWTKYITTAERNYSGAQPVTTFNTNDGEMPLYMGAESRFVPVDGLPLYNNNSYGIVNYCTLKDGQLIGRIYGGIVALQSNGNSIGTQYGTSCSNKVYKVIFHRFIPVANK